MKFRIIAISIIVLCCIIMYFMYSAEIRAFFSRKKRKPVLKRKVSRKDKKKANTSIRFIDEPADDDFYLDEPEDIKVLDEAEMERRKRWDDDWL